MLTFSLQSGSSGNCIYVEAGETRLLIDAGISARQVKKRLALRGRRMEEVAAVLITHDHNDHVRHAGVYQRLFDLPTYMTDATHTKVRVQLGKARHIRKFRRGEPFTVGEVTVHSLATPHDAVDGAAFILEHGGRRLGIFTDLGHPFAGLGEALASVDAAYLESNYDPELLAAGPYPAPLKARIRGPAGHLSNAEAATLLAAHGGRLSWAALAHLSEHNNTPDLALAATAAQVGRLFPAIVADRAVPSEIMEV